MKPCNHDDPSWCTDACEPSPREKLRQRVSALEQENARLQGEVGVLRSALDQVRQTYENSSRAKSKGAGHYTVEFFVACLSEMDEALASTADAAKAFEERIRADERSLTLMEAEKVAEGYAVSCGINHQGSSQLVSEDIAAAIRALGEK